MHIIGKTTELLYQHYKATTIDYFITESYPLLDSHIREKVIPINKFPPNNQMKRCISYCTTI